eukprot:gb/GEZJ01000944.1/.p1 GENE.gb/GEZJ01000944.1/~~gb/GEZJ01000944.1/.p1  ORF type:complete len:672 (+),score=94.06 gb/GEZJ01000944.1/:150-2165(+)
MAPRRKHLPFRPSQKQSSISDFFNKKTDTTSPIPTFALSRSPQGTIKRPRRKSSRRNSPLVVKQEALPRNVKRITADTAAVQDALNTLSQYNPTVKKASVKKELSSASTIKPQRQRKSTRQKPPDEDVNQNLQPMDIEHAPSPLTKEELLVEEALRSLDCSQDMPEDQPPRDATSCSDASLSSSEDSDEELAKLEMIRATRRSGRASNPVQRFDPSHVPETSVFGPAQVRSRGKNDVFRNPDTYLAKLIRERNSRAKAEGQLQQMREDIEKPTQAQEDEEMFAFMAKSEQEAEERFLAAIEKYSAPVPLFSKSFSIAEMPAKYLVRGGADVLTPISSEGDVNTLDYVHDMLVDVANAGERGDRALSILLSTLTEKPLPNVRIHPVDYRIVYFLAVFDTTSPNSRPKSRDELVDALVYMVQNELHMVKSARIKLPTLMRTLYKYGATMSDWRVPQKVDESIPQDGALDSQIPHPERVLVSDDFKRALRNLKRACRIAAAFIRLGIPLNRVIGVKSDKTEEEVLCALGLAVRILLSAFGNRLYCEVGEIIIELLNLIPNGHWPRFRLQAAKYLLSICARLELHVELVAHLVPQKNERSRYLALDLGFLSFAQWCRGPSNDPIPHSVHDYHASKQAKKSGLRIRSYCLADVTSCGLYFQSRHCFRSEIRQSFRI